MLRLGQYTPLWKLLLPNALIPALMINVFIRHSQITCTLSNLRLDMQSHAIAYSKLDTALIISTSLQSNPPILVHNALLNSTQNRGCSKCSYCLGEADESLKQQVFSASDFPHQSASSTTINLKYSSESIKHVQSSCCIRPGALDDLCYVRICLAHRTSHP